MINHENQRGGTKGSLEQWRFCNEGVIEKFFNKNFHDHLFSPYLIYCIH